MRKLWYQKGNTFVEVDSSFVEVGDSVAFKYDEFCWVGVVAGITLGEDLEPELAIISWLGKSSLPTFFNTELDDGVLGEDFIILPYGCDMEELINFSLSQGELFDNGDPVFDSFENSKKVSKKPIEEES